MEIVILFCLFIGLSQCDQSHPNDLCWRQCAWEDYAALVKCPAVGKGVCTCTKKEGEGECEEAVVTNANEYNEADGGLKWTDCQHIVDAFEASFGIGTTPFFRWEDKETNGHPETFCYFLSKCVDKEGHCVPFEGSPCVAGPAGPADENGCEEGGTEVCEPVVWKEEGLHWTCFSKSKVPVNPYTETKLDQGTTCQSGEGKDVCSTWVWSVENTPENVPKVANVICGESAWESANDALFLQWSKEDPTAVLPDSKDADGIAKDAECKCDTFKIPLDVYNANPGLSLICENGVYDPTDEGIEYGNACAVLCDVHLTKYIECYRGNWMNTIQYPFEPVQEDEIGCSTPTTTPPPTTV